MQKLVTLQLNGDLSLQGFHCTLAIGCEGERPQAELQGDLPPAPELEKCLQQWKQSYQLLRHVVRIHPQQIIYVGAKNLVEDCRQAAEKLAEVFTQWLTAEPFRGVDQLLRETLNREEQIRILIRTSNVQLHQLPWHLWDMVDGYPHSEVAIAAVSFKQKLRPLSPKSQGHVRILAIVGDSRGIDLEADQSILNALPNTEVTYLIEPQRQALNDHLWDQPWDILFFAGHSQTNDLEGQIAINPTDKLSLAELQYGLRQAITHGLQLAIFNSCEGLGLAYDLKELQLPQMIVMRDPVPDQVAHAFLRYFLDAYAQGASFYLASRQARERLQGLEQEFPCASWLPMIIQHPATIPPQWQQLQANGGRHTQTLLSPKGWAVPSLKRIGGAIALSTLITGLTLGVRWLGGLMTTELWAYDTLLQLRPSERQDDRLLIITIDDADIRYQEQNGMQLSHSLSSQAWTLLIEKLNGLKPHSVGLDIYRSTPLSYETQAGIKTPTWPLFAICKVPSVDDGDSSGVDPPPNISSDYVGFSDLTIDPDDVLRRHLLAMKNPSFDSKCTARNAFSLLTALHYLETKARIFYQLTPAKEFKFGDVTFSRLTSNAGGYHHLDAAGYQMLLNFRSRRSLHDIAPTLRLRDLLENKIPKQRLEQLQNRIVLVGVTALTSRDDWLTPYSRGQATAKRKLSGVVVQAQMISQLLSAVQDRRPLIWWLPEWGEALWIWGWALVGTLATVVANRPLRWVGMAILVLILLMGVCYLFILQAGWLPLIPAAIAMILSLAIVARWQQINMKATQMSE
ncbi:CHASE2 domain-containing protein [Acaryochloris sp. IP29b_bin.148]|uniref:CHASE2 domain-containing protein n=1 Tax=Acaryochloris sp. IP29b_bin.148 TaxID=2969218 RepID=UPI00263A2A88|nr:CHASE2 domain-containing protein [Acaryochloris sp. IP29b_bin.148]